MLGSVTHCCQAGVDWCGSLRYWCCVILGRSTRRFAPACRPARLPKNAAPCRLIDYTSLLDSAVVPTCCLAPLDDCCCLPLACLPHPLFPAPALPPCLPNAYLPAALAPPPCLAQACIHACSVLVITCLPHCVVQWYLPCLPHTLALPACLAILLLLVGVVGCYSQLPSAWCCCLLNLTF